jgi:sulfide dehydrogenase cytochrome subunit
VIARTRARAASRPPDRRLARRAWLLAACLAAAGGASTASATEDFRDYVLASACLTCHGPDGAGEGAIPAIAGRSAAEIATALREFRDGRRTATVMGRLAAGYDDAEIERIAAWLTAGPPPSRP